MLYWDSMTKTILLGIIIGSLIIGAGVTSVFALNIQLKGTVDVDGNQIKNVGDPTDANDAVTLAFLEGSQYVPFMVEISPNVACGVDNEAFVTINSNTLGNVFNVNSILLGVEQHVLGDNFSITDINIGTTNHVIVTMNLLSTVVGGIVGVELLGTPVSGSPGNIPHQLSGVGVAENDIQVELFCEPFDVDDIVFKTVIVSGWKKATDNITVDLT